VVAASGERDMVGGIVTRDRRDVVDGEAWWPGDRKSSATYPSKVANRAESHRIHREKPSGEFTLIQAIDKDVAACLGVCKEQTQELATLRTQSRRLRAAHYLTTMGCGPAPLRLNSCSSANPERFSGLERPRNSIGEIT